MPSPACHVDASRLREFLPAGGGWQDNCLPQVSGQARFRTARIAAGMTVTHSRCALTEDFRSRIEHEGPTCVLGFGLSGGSLFGLGGEAPRHEIRPGDVWLFQTADLSMDRLTPARSGGQMLALKFDASRLHGLLETTVETGGTRALRLGRSPDAAAGLAALTDNPLLRPLERLQAESHALGLLARWLDPAPAVEDTGGILGRDEQRGVARAMDLLVSRLEDPPSLEELAREAGMSHTRLNRCFRRLHGTTVFGWLRTYRLELACRYLAEGRYSVTEIAFLCGFSSSSHFASLFRQMHGCCPGDYRRGQG
ncbi:helix-turn-helix transcriptional regulator [Novispirillum itersonii]|uniref:AraC family transcriptional regulator n=1 Tax=Novispirillum itersonii TaxID=189 RepID=A0A7W9ZIM8_NOVIT|nr:AraC family transcriptional regulator [Novispirillum itersonii]MBB6212141.1 AraC family transcriptional regulator [Novispirillum itersonii]